MSFCTLRELFQRENSKLKYKNEYFHISKGYFFAPAMLENIEYETNNGMDIYLIARQPILKTSTKKISN